MAITSEKKQRLLIQFKSAQSRYAIVYIVITFCVLLFLNIYSSKISQDMFCRNKESTLILNCNTVADDIAALNVVNRNTISELTVKYENMGLTRLIITGPDGTGIYDSQAQNTVINRPANLPEIPTALEGNDVFNWSYSGGVMRSSAATPIYSYGMLIGCVYMLEYDAVQGALIASLQNNILLITLVFELFVILYSFMFSTGYARRLLKITKSIRDVRSGDYSKKIDLHGHDELKELSNEFNDLIQRLQVSENKRSQFVSDASHELKTPLASIKLLSDSILQNDMDPSLIKEFVADIGTEAERLNRMSQKLLALSGSESEVSEEEYSIINIAPVIERATRLLTATALDANVNVETRITTDSPVLIREDDLYQIIFNLVENGIKYNKHGGNLTILLTREHDEAVISISDNGVGIPAESLEHIFERFYRVDKARSRSTGGSGLGLSIVRSMVERNHGIIAVDSTVGIGTSFTLTFPVFDIQEEGHQM